MGGQKRIEVSTSVRWAKCHLRNHTTSSGLQDLAVGARATQFKGTSPDHMQPTLLQCTGEVQEMRGYTAYSHLFTYLPSPDASYLRAKLPIVSMGWRSHDPPCSAGTR